MRRTLDALAHPLRRTLLIRLRDRGECAVQDLAEGLDVTGPALSHHLNVLAEAGLVDRERRGRFVFYRFQANALEEVLSWLMALTEEATPHPTTTQSET